MVLYPCRDVTRLAAFFEGGLGLPIAFQDGDRFVGLRAGSGLLALAGPEESIAGSSPAVGFLVTDIDATISRLCALGATLVRPTEAGDHELRAVLEDPAGNPFVVYTPRRHLPPA
jgi:predicted enzyme related to lactoylglutathione lyase